MMHTQSHMPHVEFIRYIMFYERICNLFKGVLLCYKALFCLNIAHHILHSSGTSVDFVYMCFVGVALKPAFVSQFNSNVSFPPKYIIEHSHFHRYTPWSRLDIWI